MRYVCMHRVSPEDEADLPPPPGLVEGMGRLIGELASTGRFLAGEGLRPSAQRVRLRRTGSHWTVGRGPLAGENELPTGLVILSVRSMDEALDWARRWGDAVAAEEVEVGPLTEPWHLGMGEEPADAPLRCMLLPKATRASEAGTPLRAPERDARDATLAAMRSAGVLAFEARLAPSAKAVRARYRDNERTLLDGPFAESKELVGGFCLLELDSLDEALRFADRFVAVLGGTRELDLRPLAAPEGS